MDNSNMRFSKLNNSFIINSSIQKANLALSDIENALIKDSNFSSSSFQDAAIHSTIFKNSDLSFANFTNSSIMNITLDGVIRNSTIGLDEAINGNHGADAATE
jgi:uncharacterized protein YjbI with pentapeptide repeats